MRIDDFKYFLWWCENLNQNFCALFQIDFLNVLIWNELLYVIFKWIIHLLKNWRINIWKSIQCCGRKIKCASFERRKCYENSSFNDSNLLKWIEKFDRFLYKLCHHRACFSPNTRLIFQRRVKKSLHARMKVIFLVLNECMKNVKFS